MGKRKRYLVAYFAVPETIEETARALAELTGAELFEIRAGKPYTEKDLDMTNRRSRACYEARQEYERPMIKDGLYNMPDYDGIYLGYTVWECGTPRIIQTFLEEYDYTGKTVVPFTVPGCVGFEESVAALRALYPAPEWSEPKILHELPSRGEAFRWARRRRGHSLQSPDGNNGMA